MNRLIAAIDTADRSVAARQAALVGPYCGLLKLGLEFFTANGPAAIAAMDPARIFLDLKLHDIPQTVRGAVRAAASLGPAMLTVHAAGGPDMIAAAVEGLGSSTPGTGTVLLAVTVLTSLDSATLAALGVAGGARQQVLRLGRMAIEAGADGLVCSPHEARPLRAMLGPGPVLVVPGIRPRACSTDDQARVMTPAEAVAEGADWIVVGRPILGAADPAKAAREIAEEIHAARHVA